MTSFPMRSRKPLDDAPHAEANERSLADAFIQVRAYTERLAAALSPEDQCIQSMEDASPAKWHRAHTTWFFEQFVLAPNSVGYEVFDPRFQFLFNSYYEAVGARQPRWARGMITRPTADDVGRYRSAIDAKLLEWLPGADQAAQDLVVLGLHHEQQHQELLQTDILHAFAQNPLAPAAVPGWREPVGRAGPTSFVDMPGGIARIGHRIQDASHKTIIDASRKGIVDASSKRLLDVFAFDNEGPAHQVLIAPHKLATRLVRNSEFLAFIEAGGYRDAGLWMSDGWARVCSEGWTEPFYWRHLPDGWQQMSLGGLVPLDLDAAVRHISWYEADAFARWSDARLPTEAELEIAHAVSGIFELTGHVWQWTNSAYLPYPGFKAAQGAVGEYNGKFMINQMVLRGSSMATPPGHARSTYRNFFQPEKRWQFTGIRLARD